MANHSQSWPTHAKPQPHRGAGATIRPRLQHPGKAVYGVTFLGKVGGPVEAHGEPR